MVQSQPRQIVRKNLSQKNPAQNRANGMAQVVDSLPSRCEALNSNPSTTKKKISVGSDAIPMCHSHLHTYLSVPMIPHVHPTSFFLSQPWVSWALNPMKTFTAKLKSLLLQMPHLPGDTQSLPQMPKYLHESQTMKLPCNDCHCAARGPREQRESCLSASSGLPQRPLLVRLGASGGQGQSSLANSGTRHTLP
jgi:hypothetical protein